MEILTLLKANIRKKKGTFISVMLLTAIVITVMTSILSAQDNYRTAIEASHSYSDIGDVNAYVRTTRLTDEIRTAVEKSALVERVDYFDAIATNGADVGEINDPNSYFLTTHTEEIRLYNENQNGYMGNLPEIQKGEIYLPLGLKSKLTCSVGDTITVHLINDNRAEFTVKGFVEEPLQGSMVIGWKLVFIGHEDYEELYELCQPLETEDMHSIFTVVRVHQAEDAGLSAAKFQRQLNLETGLIDVATGALNIDQSVRYSTLMPDIVLDIVLAFAVFLFLIVLIVMSHSIGTEIEIDYVTLGVLKSQGFSKGKIRAVILLQYLLAQVTGVVLGSLLAFPIEGFIGAICQTITGVLPTEGLSTGKSMLCAALLLVLSALLIVFKTRKVASISPVRAISGGREEIYFDSRLNAPITKKGLSASLSLRQLTSAKRRYIGTIFIVSILTFCMITVNLTGVMLSSHSAQNAMGIIVPDMEVYHTERENPDCWEDVEEIILSHTEIREQNAMINGYVSLNGENLLCQLYLDPEHIGGLYRGRAPLYENEIVITEMVAETLEIGMGDEVTVTSQDKSGTFIVSGIFQSTYDSGMSFAMNFEGAEKLGLDASTDWAYHYYILEDSSQAEAIAEEIEEKYGSFLGCTAYTEEYNPITSQYSVIVDVLKVIIYTFSILFAFVVVRMVCTKTFVQERRDIGIYKALGFTSSQLRLNFAIRFLLIAVIGSIIGVVLSMLFSAQMLGMLLSLIGLSRIVLEYDTMSLVIPMIAVSFSFFVFAYLASGRIRRVAIRELVIE
ncbi:MAG: FtsX-like permease family protein [Ruminococcus sp.]|nr:FtsX-like permease family protein [Ruminococcus sp.]